MSERHKTNMTEVDPPAHETGVICRFEDVLAGRFSPSKEYASEAMAIRVCGLLKLPLMIRKGEYRLWKLGERVGMRLVPCNPIILWENDQDGDQEVHHGDA